MNSRPLLTGVYNRGHLRYVGHTDFSFTGEILSEFLSHLIPLVRPDSPFASFPKASGGAVWVKLRLVS